MKTKGTFYSTNSYDLMYNNLFTSILYFLGLYIAYLGLIVIFTGETFPDLISPISLGATVVTFLYFYIVPERRKYNFKGFRRWFLDIVRYTIQFKFFRFTIFLILFLVIITFYISTIIFYKLFTLLDLSYELMTIFVLYLTTVFIIYDTLEDNFTKTIHNYIYVVGVVLISIVIYFFRVVYLENTHLPSLSTAITYLGLSAALNIRAKKYHFIKLRKNF